MKTLILLIFICSFGLLSTAKADTISYYHVYYNGTKINDINEYSKGVVILKEADIKMEDSLEIKYFFCAICVDCENHIEIKNERNQVITKGENIEPFNSIRISVYELLIYHRKHKNEFYKVWFHEKPTTRQADIWLIFKIKIE